jgi:homoserine dehydrogenase
MPHFNLAMLGFGNVGRALARLLLRKGAEIESLYGITFSLTGIYTGRHGGALDRNGIDPERAAALVEAGGRLDGLSQAPVPEDALAFIRQCGADVLFENTPVNYETGQPAVDHLRAALELGMHALTANKGPVVHAYRELTGLARSKGRRFYFESTVMDGCPIFSLFRDTLPSARLRSFRGILNSTTNLILTRMESGESFDEAVAYAQKIGIAETDPSGDIDGWDAAVKVAALATVLMGAPLKPAEIDRQGIRGITAEEVIRAKDEGKRWKLVCSARLEGDGAGQRVIARVAPELVGRDSAMFAVENTTSIAEFETDVLGKLSVIEADPGPHTTAYGLLADFLNSVRER